MFSISFWWYSNDRSQNLSWSCLGGIREAYFDVPSRRREMCKALLGLAVAFDSRSLPFSLGWWLDLFCFFPYFTFFFYYIDRCWFRCLRKATSLKIPQQFITADGWKVNEKRLAYMLGTRLAGEVLWRVWSRRYFFQTTYILSLFYLKRLVMTSGGAQQWLSPWHGAPWPWMRWRWSGRERFDMD